MSVSRCKAHVSVIQVVSGITKLAASLEVFTNGMEGTGRNGDLSL